MRWSAYFSADLSMNPSSKLEGNRLYERHDVLTESRYFQGIAILTTNRKEEIDEAFKSKRKTLKRCATPC